MISFPRLQVFAIAALFAASLSGGGVDAVLITRSIDLTGDLQTDANGQEPSKLAAYCGATSTGPEAIPLVAASVPTHISSQCPNQSSVKYVIFTCETSDPGRYIECMEITSGSSWSVRVDNSDRTVAYGLFEANPNSASASISVRCRIARHPTTPAPVHLPTPMPFPQPTRPIRECLTSPTGLLYCP